VSSETIQLNKIKQSKPQADLVEVTYYTDPLCCWSWAFEQEWQRLKLLLNGRMKWRYCMGGLLPAWEHFQDIENIVSRPVQMGPVWMHVAAVTGVPIQHTLWVTDPPASSYPACYAVKCAELQSDVAGERCLSLLRRACMLEGKNIAKETVLLEIAAELEKDAAIDFNLPQFKADMKSSTALELLRKDLDEVASLRIHRFPTLVIKRVQHPSLLIKGFHSAAAIMEIAEL
jgi:putative protein-disulfide isomerase